MLQRSTPAGLVWPTALSLAGLAVLIGLGTWQLQRKQWKDQLIAKIAARVAAGPAPLSQAQQLWLAGGDIEYLHVTARGRLHHDKERYLYAPAKSGLGWHVYTPLEWAPSQVLWVNRGFVPDSAQGPGEPARGAAARRGRGDGARPRPARHGPIHAGQRC